MRIVIIVIIVALIHLFVKRLSEHARTLYRKKTDATSEQLKATHRKVTRVAFLVSFRLDSQFVVENVKPSAKIRNTEPFPVPK